MNQVVALKNEEPFKDEYLDIDQAQEVLNKVLGFDYSRNQVKRMAVNRKLPFTMDLADKKLVIGRRVLLSEMQRRQDQAVRKCRE